MTSLDPQCLKGQHNRSALPPNVPSCKTKSFLIWKLQTLGQATELASFRDGRKGGVGHQLLKLCSSQVSPNDPKLDWTFRNSTRGNLRPLGASRSEGPLPPFKGSFSVSLGEQISRAGHQCWQKIGTETRPWSNSVGRGCFNNRGFNRPKQQNGPTWLPWSESLHLTFCQTVSFPPTVKTNEADSRTTRPPAPWLPTDRPGSSLPKGRQALQLRSCAKEGGQKHQQGHEARPEERRHGFLLGRSVFFFLSFLKFSSFEGEPNGDQRDQNWTVPLLAV